MKTARGQSIAAFGAGAGVADIAYGAEHGWLYVIEEANGASSGSLSAYDGNGVLQTPSVTGLPTPTHLAYNPGSGLLYVLNGGNNTLSIVTQDGVTLSTVSSATATTLSPIP